MSTQHAEGSATISTDVDEDRRASGMAVGSAVWVFSFLILRIFAVSGYNWETAFLVSTTMSLNDGLSILFGSLMAGHVLVAVLLIFVQPILIAALVWGAQDRRLVMLLAAVVGLVILITLTASFGSWWLPVTATLVLVSFVMIRRLPEANKVRKLWAAIILRAVGVAGAAVLVVAAFLQTPWVPHEVIETTNDTINGYVMSVDSGYLNVLTDDHEFVIIVSSDVISRE